VGLSGAAIFLNAYKTPLPHHHDQNMPEYGARWSEENGRLQLTMPIDCEAVQVMMELEADGQLPVILSVAKPYRAFRPPGSALSGDSHAA
jgi:hypothetical protein